MIVNAKFFNVAHKQNNLFIHVCVRVYYYYFRVRTSLPAYACLESTGNRLFEKS